MHEEVSDRFWSKVERVPFHECWLWTGARHEFGYGFLGVGGKQLGAHRVSWEMHNGAPIPDGLCVLHKCDNPECTRPDHLFLGTQQDNMTDKIRKGRANYKAPKTLWRGDNHWSRARPEALARAERNGRSTHPEAYPRGERHHYAKLTEARVREIRDSRERQNVLAKRYNVHLDTISLILRRRTWKHI